MMMRPVYPAEEPIILAQLVDAKTLNQSVTKKPHTMNPEDDHEIRRDVETVTGQIKYPYESTTLSAFNPQVSQIKKPQVSWNRPAGSVDNPPSTYRSNYNPPEHNFDLSMDNENPVLMSTMDENASEVSIICAKHILDTLLHNLLSVKFYQSVSES